MWSGPCADGSSGLLRVQAVTLRLSCASRTVAYGGGVSHVHGSRWSSARPCPCLLLPSSPVSAACFHQCLIELLERVQRQREVVAGGDGAAGSPHAGRARPVGQHAP